MVFLFSLFILVKASDYFVDSAETIGIGFGIPPFIVGVTIVGIGTSLPELVSSIFAVMNGSSEIVIGNVLGSNITNVFLVLGIAAVVGKKFNVEYDLMSFDLPMLTGSSFLLALMVIDGTFSLPEAFICILGLLIYMLNAITPDDDEEEDSENSQGKQDTETVLPKIPPKSWLLLCIAPIFIFVGAKFAVDAVIAIANIINIGAEVIALSAVALGTSLPEVLVTINAAKRGNPEMAIGNVIGSNIFNTFAVMGFSALFGTLTIPQSVIAFSVPMSIVATIMCVIITMDRKINQWEGSFLLLFYVFFIAKLYNWV